MGFVCISVTTLFSGAVCCLGTLLAPPCTFCWLNTVYGLLLRRHPFCHSADLLEASVRSSESCNVFLHVATNHLVFLMDAGISNVFVSKFCLVLLQFSHLSQEMIL